MSLAKKLKMIVKGSEKPTYGTEPNDPWSAKAGITESSEAMLNAYLNSRGINPQFVSKDTKISHAKSAEFLKWKQDHDFNDPRIQQRNQNEEVEQIDELKKSTIKSWLSKQEVVPPKKPGMDRKAHNQRIKTRSKSWDSALDRLTGHKPVSEETDEKDMVCFDIPLLIRVLEFTREEMSSDIELHNMVERLINMRHDVPLDMTHYDEITKKLVKENHIAIAMGKMLDDESGMVLSQIEELERGCAMIRSYIGKDYEKQLPGWVQAKVTLATDYMSTVGNYLVSKNEKVNEETKPTALDKFRKASAEREVKHKEIEKNQSKNGSGMTSAIDRLEKHLNKEDIYQDSSAATQTPCDCGTTPDQTVPEYSRKKELSKSARIIKSLYKKHNVKEELYDSEKEDKSVATYGKKPKVKIADIDDLNNDNQAAATLSGGTTLTGQKRDTLEIDPVMKRTTKPDAKKTDK